MSYLSQTMRKVSWRLRYPLSLYLICRWLQPDNVVETGVQWGVSSAFILSALDDSGSGTLYSIDFPGRSYVAEDGTTYRNEMPWLSDLGLLVPERLRNRWKLHLGVSKAVLPTILQRLVQIDLFLHDSEHTYANMLFEYRTAWPRLRAPIGVLASDDIGANRAFVDFTASVGAKPLVFTSNPLKKEKFGFIFKE